jgi:RNA polymerase sigma-70 factor (ECF subfamily)
MAATSMANVHSAAVQRAVVRRASWAHQSCPTWTIQRAGSGDRDALGDLYARYAPPVHRHVLAIVGDEHEAQDVTQLVFVKLMGEASRYEEGRGEFSVWILRVARNLAIDEVRRRRPVPTSDMGEPQACDDAAMELGHALREALAALSDEQREVVVLRHLAGMGTREIAVRLSKSEAAVHALHHRARAAMRASLLRAGVAPVTRVRA